MDVQIKNTQCGPQVTYTDTVQNISYGIAKTDDLLVSFVPCLHQHPVINLNDKIYSIKTEEFIREVPKFPTALKI